MTSPDARSYLSFSPTPPTAVELAVVALEELQLREPSLTLQSGMVEVSLTEAHAFVAKSILDTLEEYAADVFEAVVSLYGIDRDLGVAPTTTVEFTTTGPVTIPAGTEVVLETSIDRWIFETTADLVVVATTGTVAAIAVRAGSAVNGTPAGTVLRIRSGFAALEAAETASEITGGTDPEDDTTYLLRAAQRLAQLSSVVVQAEQYTALALAQAGVFRAYTIPLYNADSSTPGDTGHVSVAVRGEAANLSGPEKDAIDVGLTEAAQLGTVVHVIDPTINTVNVTVEISVVSGFDAATVIADVEDALTAFLSPSTWGWSQTVRLSDLYQTIEGVSGVDWSNIVSPVGDVALTGVAPLASAGTLLVTEA